MAMGEAQRRPAWPAAAVTLLLVATAALVLREQLGGWVPPHRGFSVFGPPQQRERPPPPHCRHWAAVDRLAGGCVAEQEPGTTAFTCCSNPGTGFGCRPCLSYMLQTLQCIAPRYQLLRPAPGCDAALRPPPPLPPQLPAQPVCSLPSAAVFAGKWALTYDMPAWDTPATPLLAFQPAAACAQQRPVGAAEVPACLSAAGIDRVVVSGDSTVRHLYSRLIGLIRQQQQVVDGGASLVYGHYALTARWPTTAAAAAAAAGGSDSSSGGRGSSPVVTDSLWFSPPGNILPGWFNDSAIADGLHHLLRHSAAASSVTAEAVGTGGADAAAGGGDAPSQLILDFVLGSSAAWQQAHVKQYVASPMGGNPYWRRRTLLVLSLCVWEDRLVWPPGWLEFLADMRRQVGLVALATCPLERLKLPERAAPRSVIGRRNELMRQMVEAARGGSANSSSSEGDGGGRRSGGFGFGSDSSSSSGSSGSGSGSGSPPVAPLLLIDVDAMTRGLPQGVTISPMDHHYQCYLSSNSKYQNGSLEWSGGDGGFSPWYPPRRFDQLVHPGTGSCADPVGYAAWQLLFSMLCKK